MLTRAVCLSSMLFESHLNALNSLRPIHSLDIWSADLSKLAQFPCMRSNTTSVSLLYHLNPSRVEGTKGPLFDRDDLYTLARTNARVVVVGLIVAMWDEVCAIRPLPHLVIGPLPLPSSLLVFRALRLPLARSSHLLSENASRFSILFISFICLRVLGSSFFCACTCMHMYQLAGADQGERGGRE